MKKLFFLFMIFPFIFACDEKDDPIVNPEPEPEETISLEIRERNEWIGESMAEVYLWESTISTELDPQTEPDSEEYFEKLVYREEDNWSWINNDYQATLDLYSGVSTTAGHVYSLMYYNDSKNILGFVEYVMKGTPAEEAGIKRGDIFLSIDGEALTLENYSALLSKVSYSLSLAKLDGNTLIRTNVVEITEVENFQEDPIHIVKTIEAEGKKIAYIMYNSFLYEFADEFETAIAGLKSEGVTDLVLDLRYNGGGSVAAEIDMASLLVQPEHAGEIFHTQIWNDLYNNFWTSNYGSDYLNDRFEEKLNNLNLTGKICALVTSGTASASEGLLNGLMPYSDLTLIGETTHGKYTAMSVIGDTYSKTDGYSKSEWAIIPIIYESRNALGKSVKGGMVPMYTVEDDPWDGYALGDPDETMLKAAIETITAGSPVVASTKSAITRFGGEKLDGKFRDGKRIVPMPSFDDKNRATQLMMR